MTRIGRAARWCAAALVVSALVAVPSAERHLVGAARPAAVTAAAGLPATCADPPQWRFAWVGDSFTGTDGQRPYWSWLWGRLATVPRGSYGTLSNSWGPHDGIPGQTPGQLLINRIDGVMAADRPDVVVLIIGANLDTNGVVTLWNIGAVADRILAYNPCTRLLIGTVPYYYDQPRSIDAQFMNARLPDLVRQRDTTGTRVRLVDLTTTPLSGTVDRFHWTDAEADTASWLVWRELQHFVGVTVDNDRWLPYSAGPFARMPSTAG